MLELDERSLRYSTPEGFAGTLRPIQEALLHAVIEVEQGRPALFAGTPWSLNAAWLAEAPTAGKTALFVALAMTGMEPVKKTPRLWVSAGFRILPAERIPATLVICSASVYGHWLRELARFGPGLKVLGLNNCRDVKAAIESAQAARKSGLPAFSGYDVVVLKSGSVSTRRFPLGFGGSSQSETPTLSTIAAVVQLTYGSSWRRVVVDDFDTIPKLRQWDSLPCADFTWFVSATVDSTSSTGAVSRERRICNSVSLRASGWGIPKYMHTRVHSKPNGSAPEVEPPERVSYRSFCAAVFAGVDRRPISEQFHWNSLRGNRLLRTTAIRCTREFFLSEIKTSAYLVRQVRVTKTVVAKLLTGSGLISQHDVMEMIRCGAYVEAAEAMGFHATNAQDFVVKTIAAALSAKRRAERDLRRFEEVAGLVRGADAVRPAGDTGALRDAILDSARSDTPLSDLDAGSFPRTEDDEQALREAKGLIEGADRHAAEPLRRFKEGLQSEECQSCDVPFEDGMTVTHCCQKTLCDDCLFEGDGRVKDILTVCPFCQKFLPGQITRIQLNLDGKGFREEILKATEATGGEDERKGDESATEPGEGPQNDNRVLALLALIQDESDPPCSKIQADSGYVPPVLTTGGIRMPDGALVEGVLPPGDDMPPKDASPRRFLVFVQIEEQLRSVARSIAKFVPNTSVLTGGYLQRSDAERSFLNAEGDSALVASVAADCAGMDLPQVTHLVLLGRSRKKGETSQAVSRALRTGRMCNLMVVQIVDE
jgi:hypothetical protein